MYILTEAEVQLTHKVLNTLPPEVSNELPDAEKAALAELIAKLAAALDPDNALPTPPTGIDNTLPTTDLPDQELPEAPDGPDQSLPEGRPTPTPL